MKVTREIPKWEGLGLYSRIQGTINGSGLPDYIILFDIWV